MSPEATTQEEPENVDGVEPRADLPDHDFYEGDFPIVVEGLRTAFGDHVIHENLSLRVK